MQASGVPPTTSEAKHATEAVAHRREAEQREREAALRDEMWKAAACVVTMLRERAITPEYRIIATSDVYRYLEYRRFADDYFVGPLNQIRMKRIRARNVTGAWDMRTQLTVDAGEVQRSRFTHKYPLYLVEDGGIAGMHGMSEREWQRGILIPALEKSPGDRFSSIQHYEEAQRGLAHLQVLAEQN